jgi:hypothetical protein
VNLIDTLRDRDTAHVRDRMIALSEKERRALAKQAEQAFDSVEERGPGRPPSSRWKAIALAWLGTATARKIISEFWRVGFKLGDDPSFLDEVYAVLHSRGRPFFETLARGPLRSEGPFGSWGLVRTAVREAFIEPPEGDEYLLGVVFGVVRAREHNDVAAAYRGLLEDPTLLEREVWQLFEIDAGSQLANSNTWEPNDPERASGGFTRGDNRWLYALTRLAGEGRLDRERLLDASLDALMRDFRASTVGWYAKLHEELEPTRAERLARLDRYLSLVTSPAPSVVKAGLAALKAVEDAVPPADLARVAPTVFAQRQKNLAMETLSLIARLCKTKPEARPALLEAAAHALAHERVDVQERAIKLIETYPDDTPRGSLLAYVDGVSPTLQTRAAALTGVQVSEEEPPTVELLAPAQPRMTPELLREMREELHPVESFDELIELTAMLLEGQGDGDDCERFLDGVSRLCAARPRDFERRTAGLAKRASQNALWGAGLSGQDTVALVVEAWLTRSRVRGVFRESKTVIGVVATRAVEVAERARRGVVRPLLAFPTHSGGWIDPDVLASRLSRTGRLLNRPNALDRLQARLRAFPAIEPIRFERRIRTTTAWNRTSRALGLFAPKGTDALGELAEAARGDPLADSGNRFWFGEVAWGGMDALGVRWSLTVLPSLPEVAFAGAATAAVRTSEGAVYGHPDAVLEHALDPQVPLGAEAWLATAAALMAKSADLQRVATDLLVASVEDGRFDPHGLGEAIAWLVDNDFAKLNRLEAPLRDLSRVSALHAAQTVRAVEVFLAKLESRPPNMHAPLAVAVESSSASGRRIEDEQARATLESLGNAVSQTSKLGTLTRALLDR